MRVINGFFKWLAVLVVALSAGLLAIILLSSYKPELDIFWQRIIILAAVALLGSLSSRILFRRLPGVVLFLIAMISEILAILVIDHFYDGTYKLVFLTNDFAFQIPTVSDASQIVLVFITSLPILFFLRRRKKAGNKIQKQPASPKRRVSFQQRMQPMLHKLNPANWKIFKKNRKKSGRSIARKAPSVQSKPLHISASNGKTGTIKSTSAGTTKRKSAALKPSLPRKLRRSQANDVKLMGEEEHVCPYCLEQVHKSDKRGVVICQECGTWHHKDCWDLTGSCGVAHRNEL